MTPTPFFLGNNFFLLVEFTRLSFHPITVLVRKFLCPEKAWVVFFCTSMSLVVFSPLRYFSC